MSASFLILPTRARRRPFLWQLEWTKSGSREVRGRGRAAGRCTSLAAGAPAALHARPVLLYVPPHLASAKRGAKPFRAAVAPSPRDPFP
jgi:hypothetical protein